MAAVATRNEELTERRKAAILLVQLGLENAGPVLAAMEYQDIKEIVAEVARLKTIDSDLANGVVKEFIAFLAKNRNAGMGGLELARELLDAGLGSTRAKELMSELEASIAEHPFQFMRRTEGEQIVTFIQDEHPQTIALVLAHLSPEQASKVLSVLEDELQAEVAQRIAAMGRTSPEVVRRVEVVLQRRMSSLLQPSESSFVGGLTPLVGIISRTDRQTEKLILEGLEERDPQLAEQVRAQMFLFEDILLLDDRSVQMVLREVTPNELAMALKGVEDEVRDKITRNLSSRAAENLIDELEVLGRVRLSAVEEAQTKIVGIIRRLEDKGEIVVMRGGGDDYVV